MEDKERARSLDATLGQIEKQFGKGSIVRLGSKDAIVAVPSISTGSISLDAAMGIGGFPRGRVCEVYGPESSGKTTIALQVVAEAQKKGGMAAYIDVEHAIEAEAGQLAAQKILGLGGWVGFPGNLAAGECYGRTNRFDDQLRHLLALHAG